MNDDRPDIWKMQTRFDTRGLIEALHHADPAIRKRAVVALRAVGAVESIPALKEALHQEQDSETRAALVAALATLETDQNPLVTEDAPTLAPTPHDETQILMETYIAQLKSGESARVLEAIQKLSDIKNKRAVEALVLLFNDQTRPSQERLQAAEALLKLDSAPIEVALLGTLRSPTWKIRRNSAAILGRMRAAWAVQPLAEALKDEIEIVRRTALAALKAINTPEARQALGATRPSRPTTSDTKRLSPSELPLNRQPKQGPMPDTPTQRLRKPSADDSPHETTKPKRTEKLTWPKRADSLERKQRGKTADLNPDKLKEAEERLKRQSDEDKP